VPPYIEVSIPIGIILLESCVIRLVEFIISSVHKVIEFITAVEIATSFTWALKFAFFCLLTPFIVSFRATALRILSIATSWTFEFIGFTIDTGVEEIITTGTAVFSVVWGA